MSQRFVSPRLPWGWFAVATSAELAPGALVTRSCFGEELVLYRDRDGEPHAVDAYCPHLGAHLGHGGVIEADGLRCSFHGWRFDGRGICVEVPGCSAVRPTARLRSWPVCERAGLIVAWHDPDGGPPTLAAPALAFDGFTEPRIAIRTLATQPQEVAENSADQAHFAALHRARDV